MDLMDSDWDDGILSELSDSAFDFPPFEFEDEDEEEGECSSSSSSSDENHDVEIGNDICLDEALFPNLIKQLASSNVKRSKTTPVNNQLEVLVNVDNDHRKIITLNGGKDNLQLAFAKAISTDPALFEYIGVKVSFQVYNKKFNSWVDYDKTKELEDGMHLSAVFLNKTQPAASETNEPVEDDYIQSLNEYVQKRSSNKYKNQQKRNSNKYKNQQKRNSNKYKKQHQPYRVNRKWQRKNKNSQNSTANADIETTNSEPIANTPNHIHGIQCKKIKKGQKDYESGGFVVEPTCSTLQEEGVNNMEIYNCPSESKENKNYFLQGLPDKDPISALYEVCAKLKWLPPKFELLRQCTVGAENHVWMKVTVNDEVYSPALAERKTKEAKRSAAKLCLEQIGVLPKNGKSPFEEHANR